MSQDTLRKLTLAEASRLVGPRDRVFVRDRAAFLASLGVGFGALAGVVEEDAAVPEHVVEIRRRGKVVGRLIGGIA